MRKVLVIAVLAVVVGSIASAEIGNPSITLGNIGVSGWDVDVTIEASTTGRTSPTANNIIFAYLWLFYPTATYTTTTVDYSTFWRSYLADPANDEFDETFNFSVTAPVNSAGLWQAQWGAAFYEPNAAFTRFTLVYEDRTAAVTTLPAPTYTPDPNAGGNPVPMSMPALVILGLLLAGVGVMILRRS